MAQAFVCRREKLRVRVSALPTHTLASGKEAHVKAQVLTLVEKSWAINQDLVQYKEVVKDIKLRYIWPVRQ